jgi:hypothetical protein
MSEMMQVPRRLVEELASYLEEPGEPRISVPGNGEWTRSMVKRLKQEAAIYRGAVATGDMTARRAGELVPLVEITEATGLSRTQLSSDLGAFSKKSRRLFGQKIWPFRALDSAAGTMYHMQPEMAEWWLQD